ncbi:hypothetical protein [Deinococcus yavapaiensis]|uniref:Uncharacterized protein n=1 Tax=Deinococcus yavapaiensis KR-236 TaxID=694435 RepID=A0A318S9T5_9DEIO|nr:hypothetical protein [Deinococcus yavapaiensis]PYE53842.1 hypothetical protein DES52_107100 [Deinococcus yavapaiensis KR-236]
MRQLFIGTSVVALGFTAWAAAQYTPEPTQAQLAQLRQMMSRFENVEAARAAGYTQFGDCMSNAQGAQGIHFTNQALIDDPAVDPMRPELLMYEPREDGSLRLVGVEYLVFQKAWHDKGNKASPAMLGQEFVPNMTLLPQPFYALHLWAWQYNPKGLFANWNPLVNCPKVGALAPASDAHGH